MQSYEISMKQPKIHERKKALSIKLNAFCIIFSFVLVKNESLSDY